MSGDCEKYGEAMLLGWSVYRCTQDIVKNGSAIDIVLKLYELHNNKGLIE
jgi:hypothetical protein